MMGYLPTENGDQGLKPHKFLTYENIRGRTLGHLSRFEQIHTEYT